MTTPYESDPIFFMVSLNWWNQKHGFHVINHVSNPFITESHVQFPLSSCLFFGFSSGGRAAFGPWLAACATNAAPCFSDRGIQICSPWASVHRFLGARRKCSHQRCVFQFFWKDGLQIFCQLLYIACLTQALKMIFLESGPFYGVSWQSAGRRSLV